MSTNDTVLLMASGASGVRPSLDEFTEVLRAVCADLARQLIGDAEGASKDVAITVQGAVSEAEALDVARTIARSNLLKCALYGQDANWGRVLAAVGTTDAVFDPDQLDVAINGVWVCRGGAVGEDRALVDMTAARDRHRRRPARRRRPGDGLDQRPHHRVRPRELGLLLMTATAADRPQPPRAGQGGGADRRTALARAVPRQRPSSSSTAATP